MGQTYVTICGINGRFISVHSSSVTLMLLHKKQSLSMDQWAICILWLGISKTGLQYIIILTALCPGEALQAVLWLDDGVMCPSYITCASMHARPNQWCSPRYLFVIDSDKAGIASIIHAETSMHLEVNRHLTCS